MDISLNIPKNKNTADWRTGMQPLMPVKAGGGKPQGYNIFPYHSIGEGKIFNGYPALAEWIVDKKFVALDGYAGVFWNDIKQCLEEEFEKQGLAVNWINTADYLKPVDVVQKMVAPYLGTQNSVWGTKTSLQLIDFYNFNQQAEPGGDYKLTIVIGTAAGLLANKAHLVYFDLPKNELQLRMRAASITNLGNNAPESPAEMYKRFYFVDWVVLNNYKKSILDKIEIIADAQWKEDLNWMHSADFKQALQQLGKTAFRVRPWFEPGAWGGQWIKEHIDGINKNEVNYAWSFELIVPENGLVFESDGNLLEVSFDFLMFARRNDVLGKHAEKFGDEFPIRFDFLDTWEGGNLSIQCHPSVDYIQKNFGETITQDETYYILDCEEQANVYMGFQDDIDPEAFRKELEKSRDFGTEIGITKYVQSHQAKKHDLFLLPNGTVHSAGAGNMVLEISATPYIFTFKMYDWLRLDLNGEPRAINIEHAFNNLKFDRKGEKVTRELISKQSVIEKGEDWELVHVPTHQEHFYDVHRVEFDSVITIETEDVCHVLMLVEGISIDVVTADGRKTTYHYAETFVIPAAANTYTMYNNGAKRAKVIKAFLKS
ncbi:class I mannose-6-phosphate isomerase [Mucilaginibacter boryungensis]|uniref:Class I mannose-6-phosphate isomerase n=1 Tax=Mucilaginibacter boryungensis TaxID=768480 RepID=A0ABR9XKT0_9SPHI|nr:class I mannose-6-phosphate isomerase [Mucilaginibacter boryungensis]MBE9667573.1 class I mannose-6-phosphate isomerase [Mucilaginibacter boryungensis]